MRLCMIFMLEFALVFGTVGCGMFSQGTEVYRKPGPVAGTEWVGKDHDSDGIADEEELQASPEAVSSGSNILSGLGPWGIAAAMLFSIVAGTVVIKRRKIAKEKRENEA